MRRCACRRSAVTYQASLTETLSLGFSPCLLKSNQHVWTSRAMPAELCAYCRNLPSALFQANNDEQGITGGPEIYLPPLHDLYRYAAEGCELCKIWTTKPSLRYVPQTHPVRLRRSTIAPHMSLTAYIGADDIFVVYFARMPPLWSKFVKCRRCSDEPSRC
jgi:hypothetical protein